MSLGERKRNKKKIITGCTLKVDMVECVDYGSIDLFSSSCIQVIEATSEKIESSRCFDSITYFD